LGREANRLRQELAGRESEIFKQKMVFERDIQTLTEQIDVLKKQVKAVTRKAELDLERLADEHKDRVFDLKREHKAELEGRLDEERTHWEGELSALREAHAQEKSHLVQEGSKERSKLIKKYEEKLYVLTCPLRTSRTRPTTCSNAPPANCRRR
jgi:predicted  nucleic acid-binding Zn-ribbon protein